MMKAAVTKGKGDIALAGVPIPEPGDYQCLCKILACATCTGTDQRIISGKLPWKQDYPGILGHESVGTVIQTGSRVRNIKKGAMFLRPAAVYNGEKLGDYYSLWGGFAEYGLVTDTAALLEDNPQATVNPYTKYQQEIPSGIAITPADATMLITLKETASFLVNVGVKLNSSVTILGSGSVAMGCCFFAKMFGAYPVIVVGKRDEPLINIKKLGADFVINNQKEDIKNKVMEISAGRGIDFVLDSTGNADLVAGSVPVLSSGGKIAPYALYPAGVSLENIIDRNKLISTGPSEELAHRYLLDLARWRYIPLDAFYSHCLPFNRIEEGFELLKTKKASKVVVEMEA